MLLICHALAFLPLMNLVLFAVLGEDFNDNADLAAYTGPGQVIHGGAWMLPWSTPICLVGGLVCLVIGRQRRRIIPLAEGVWLCLFAAFSFWAYPLSVHFQ